MGTKGKEHEARVEDLASWLRYALENWAPGGSDKAEKARASLDAADAWMRAQHEANSAMAEKMLAAGLEYQEAERLAERLEAVARSIREAIKPPQRDVFLYKAKLGYTVCVDGFDLGLETSWTDADSLCKAIATRRPPGDAMGYGRNFHTGKPFGAAAKNIDDTVTLGISVREQAED